MVGAVSASERCVFRLRGWRCYLFVCSDCGWRSHSADHGWSANAGRVHAQVLCPGHSVFEVDRGCEGLDDKVREVRAGLESAGVLLADEVAWHVTPGWRDHLAAVARKVDGYRRRRRELTYLSALRDKLC